MNVYRMLLAVTVCSASIAVRAADIEHDLGRVCASGREHVLVYAAGSDRPEDLTQVSDDMHVSWNVRALWDICAKGDVTVAHCHPTPGVLAPFPSAYFSTEGVGSDMSVALAMEFLCATHHPNEQGAHDRPYVSQYLVTRDGTKVAFGLGPAMVAQVHRAVAAFGQNEPITFATIKDVVRGQGSSARLVALEQTLRTIRLRIERTYAAVFTSYATMRCARSKVWDIAHTHCPIDVDAFADAAHAETPDVFYVRPYDHGGPHRYRGVVARTAGTTHVRTVLFAPCASGVIGGCAAAPVGVLPQHMPGR